MRHAATRGKVFILSSPSGGGKTTMARALLKRVPRLVRSVSVTTRPRRRTERQGVDYHFVSVAQFQRLRSRKGLLEWATVHHAYYGTPRATVERVLASGRDVVLSIDVQGARQVRRQYGARAVLIFLLPPSLRVLRERLVRRGTDAPQAIAKRLEAARQELACVRWYDYAVVNQKLTSAVAQLTAIVLAERARVC